ncbi:MAG: FtsQ-type POTRA domain-containing protein [Defluviitaleaceae bacterium]|nr:FtsQ-type POTRA domain-containing protein [Defluviitaleaceae bacterium]
MRTKVRAKIRKKRFVTSLVVAMTVFVAVAILLSPLFAIRQIDIIGNSFLCAEDILGRTELETGQNMLAFSASTVEAQISELPYVREVEVLREFPDTIVISIAERVPVANIRVANSAIYLLIDDGGMVLESAAEPIHVLPVITGIDFANFAVGEYLDVEGESIFRDVLRLSRLFTRYSFFPDIVDMSNLADIVFHTDNLNILFGNMSDMDRKIQYISAIMEQFAVETRGFIDIRDINEHPRFGLIR